MSMDEFVNTLSEQQKQALLKALSGGTFKQESISPEANNVDEDFRVSQPSRLPSNGRREPVAAKDNTWSDEGEFKDVETPEITKTPRNRSTPRMKNVKCHVCGKSSKINANFVYGEFYRCDRCTGK